MQHSTSLFARTHLRRPHRTFGISQADRLFHLYAVGKTGAGKSILVTRLTDENGKRRWLAESQAAAGGAHVAFCEKVAKPGSTYLGAYDIPFRLEVREQ